jgi:cytochrome c oxidase subunit II
MPKISKFKLLLLAIVLLSAPAAMAAFPLPWQLGFQEAATPVMAGFDHMHNYLLVVITGICLFVLLLLIIICVRFNEKRNPVPATFTHNTKLEIIWTLLPVIILVTIAVPSMKTLYFAGKLEQPEMTLKVIGHQWYWEYQYPDADNMKFDSVIVKDADLKPGQLRLLEVDNRVVVPVNTNIRVLITAADVIHSWAVPSFGVKKDAVPGRLNETWFRVNKPGTYYGQCSELCGIDHGFMPIVVQAVSKEDYAKWLEEAKKKFASSSSRLQVSGF